MRTFFAIAIAAQLLVASTVFAGTVAPQRASTTAIAASPATAGLAGFTQAKGPRPATMSGAVSVKLFNEFAKPQGQVTHIAADPAAFSGFVAGKNAALTGLVGQGQNNAVLLNGLAAKPAARK